MIFKHLVAGNTPAVDMLVTKKRKKKPEILMVNLNFTKKKRKPDTKKKKNSIDFFGHNEICNFRPSELISQQTCIEGLMSRTDHPFFRVLFAWRLTRLVILFVVLNEP